MASFHDSAFGNNDASGTTVGTTDTLTVTAGDLIVVCAKWEGATTTITAKDNTSGNALSVANAVLGHANADLFGAVLYGIATSSGSFTPEYTLGAARTFRYIKVACFTPGASKTFQLGAVNAATATSSSPSAGAAAGSVGDVAVASFALYGTRSVTAGSGWSIPVEFTSSSLWIEQQVLAGTSVTGNMTYSVSLEHVAQVAVFNEIASGGASSNWFLMGHG